MSLSNYADVLIHSEVDFKNLQNIEFKHINIENYSINILGITLMENGINWSTKPHKHSFFELHYIVRGNVYTTINGKEVEVTENEYYIIPPGTIHSHRQRVGTEHIGFDLRWEFTKYNYDNISINIANSIEIGKIYSNLLNIQLYPQTDTMGIFDLFMNLLKNSEYLSQMEIQLELVLIIIRFSKLNKNLNTTGHNKRNYKKNENQIVIAVIKFIEDNYSEEIDVNDISQHVYLSYSYISRLFKDYTGDTIVNYINNRRLRKAQYLLKCTSKSINDISSEVGFNNQNYFCNIFKKTFNIAPIAFRKNRCELDE